MKPECGSTFFLKFKDEETALDAFSYLRTQKLGGMPVQARIKSENLLKSLYVRAVNWQLSGRSDSHFVSHSTTFLPHLSSFFLTRFTLFSHFLFSILPSSLITFSYFSLWRHFLWSYYDIPSDGGAFQSNGNTRPPGRFSRGKGMSITTFGYP